MSSASGWIGTWSPGIGDPTIYGWVTVVAYLGASFLSFRAAALARELSNSRDAAARGASLFRSLGGLLFLLAVNKQLDLQTALTELGRISAHAHGWYDQRRKLQLAFIAAIGLGATVASVYVFRLARGLLRDVGLALFGMVVLLAFIAIRASSFHHVDLLLGFRLSSLSLNVVLELGGILLVASGAGRYVQRSRSREAGKRSRQIHPAFDVAVRHRTREVGAPEVVDLHAHAPTDRNEKL